jgi:imidazolonepropionase-like amidohydrolase
MKNVAGALHRAGVPLMAGTDAMGGPRIAPGASLQHELQLLIESGLTPYEAMRAATVVPATFLKRRDEFGTIATGKRADLLLLDGNPLQDVGYLAQPAGVMAGGRWFTREQLQQMLATLTSDR